MQPIALPSQVLGPDGRRYWDWAGRRIAIIAGAEDPPATPPATPPKGGDPPKADDKGDDDDAFDKERALATIRKLRETERASKTQLKELEDLRAKVQADENAKLSEQERLKKEADDAKAETARLRTERAQLVLQSTVERTATKLGFADAEDAYAHVVLNPAKLEYDDDGTPKNVESVLKALLEAKPHLKAGTGAAGGGVPATPRPQDTQSREQQIEEKRQKLAASGQYAPL